MRLLSLLILAAALAACGKTPPTAPTPEALGAELATFPQILVPISSTTWSSMERAAARNDLNRANANQYPQPYSHASLVINERDASAIVAYTGVWLTPAPIPLQPMSVQQFLRAFGSDTGTDLAWVIAPKGNIFFTREQLPDVSAAAKKAGASSEDLPYSVIRGAGR